MTNSVNQLTKLKVFLSRSLIYKSAKQLFNSPLVIFTITLVYYLSLYFSINNRSLLLVSLIYLAVIYLITKNLKLSLFLVFLAVLPFAKGKGWQIILLPKEQIQRYALFKISYFFPIYLSDFFLSLIVYLYLRSKFTGKYQLKNVPKALIPAAIIFTMFIIIVLANTITNPFPEVTILSSIQLIKLLVILCLPFLSQLELTKHRDEILAVLASGLMFQSLWVFMQRFNQGPLGKDIEVHLPFGEFGISAVENLGIQRSTGTFFEPSILGTFLLTNMALILIAGKQKYLTKRNLLKAMHLSAIFSAIALIFTGSRALYLLAIAVSGLIHRQDLKMLPQLLSKSKRLLLVGVATLLLIVSLLPYIGARLASMADLFTQYGSGTYRLQMMWYSIKLLLMRPFLGVGINLSPYFFATTLKTEKYIFDPTYPHNLLFQLLAETGIIGTLLFCLFLYLIFRSLIKVNKSWPFFNLKQINPFGVAALIFLLCAQIYPIFLNHSEIFSYLFVYLGLYIHSHVKHAQK